MLHILLIWRWSFSPRNWFITIRSWPRKALMLSYCPNLTRLRCCIWLRLDLSVLWTLSINWNYLITPSRRRSLRMRKILRGCWTYFATLREWMFGRNSELWISVVWFAQIPRFVSFWNWWFSMSTSALVSLVIDIFLLYWASRDFASLNLNLRVCALFILVEHTTCFCSELICIVYHSI